MGLADKLIARIEQQAEALAAYRQLDDKRRARIYELEGQLVSAFCERDKALADVQHWRQARQDAIAAGELMQAEIETLRGAMAADDKRLRDAEERVWPEETWGCDAPDKMADEILSLRQGIERLRKFAEQVREVYSKAHPHNWMTMLHPALAELDAEPTPATETEGVK